MTDKHTPGPWTIQSDESPLDFAVEYWIQNANGEDICSCSDQATANLIAAAPDLLDALRQVVAVYDGNHVGGIVGMSFDKARAAIAKAEGETK